MFRKALKWFSLVLLFLVVPVIAVFLLIQLAPYGRDHTNPPVLSEPAWDSPETRALAVRACFDCHSNETNWDPWYTRVAPFSWLVAHDVEEGREHLNFSEWNSGGRPRELEEVWEVVEEGEMPPGQYTILHPEAVLTAEEAAKLIAGLKGMTNP